MNSSTIPVLAVVTLTAVAGALIGVLAAGAGVWVRHLLSFSGGLLVGMSVLLVLPEALASAPAPNVFAACVAGLLLFAGLEKFLHAGTVDPHRTWMGVLPVAAAISIHSILDGWNTVIALNVSATGAQAFAGAMALHKLTGGFAVGAVVRAAIPRRAGALVVAAALEAATMIGALLYLFLRRPSGDTWTVWLLAATGGSLIYIGFHSVRRASASAGPIAVSAGALAGFISIWFISRL